MVFTIHIHNRGIKENRDGATSIIGRSSLKKFMCLVVSPFNI
jgi:hypothetical protein